MAFTQTDPNRLVNLIAPQLGRRGQRISIAGGTIDSVQGGGYFKQLGSNLQKGLVKDLVSGSHSWFVGGNEGDVAKLHYTNNLAGNERVMRPDGPIIPVQTGLTSAGRDLAN